jgi:hypothetical protein
VNNLRDYVYFKDLTDSEWDFYCRRIAPKNNDKDFYGFGVKVCKREGRYWLNYGSYSMGGYEVIKEISQQEFDDVWSGVITFSDLTAKYPEDFHGDDAKRTREIMERWEQIGDPLYPK